MTKTDILTFWARQRDFDTITSSALES